MNARTTPTPAELADRSVQLVAWMMFALALELSLSVVEFFVSDSTAGIIDAGSKVLGVAILGLGALLFFWKFRSMSRDELRRQVAEDGFLQTAFQKAMARSWMLSFLLLVILQALDNLVLERLPELTVEIVIQSVLAIMLLFFSITFLLLTRSSSSDE